MSVKVKIRKVIVIGDNLNIIRYGAAQCLIKTCDIQEVLADVLSNSEWARWDITWKAVKRAHNAAADSIATLAVKRAGELRSNNHLANCKTDYSPPLGPYTSAWYQRTHLL